MRFAEPYWIFIGLFACAALATLYMRFDRRQAAALKTFAAGHLLNQLTASFSPRRRRLKRSLVLLGVGLLFVALARPQWGFRWEETTRRGIDILFAVDTSKSMLAQDVKPDRLTRAKLAVTDLVSQLEGDRIGLVAFAGTAFLQSPLTLDYDAFRQSLDALDTSIIPRGGTNVASAIREAQDAFATGSNNQKILVLITDGEDLEAQGVEAARAAAKDGLKIYTVGVGSTTGELIPVPVEGGGTEFAKDESGQLVKSKLDEAALKEIAQATGGTYQPLGQRGEGLEAIYQQSLAPLPKQELMSRRQKVHIERFQWPLAAALACLLVDLLIGTRKRFVATRRRFVPVPAERRAQSLRPAAATALALFALPAVLHASPQTAERAYEKGKFEKAQQEYKQAAEKNPDAPVLQFNLGAAAYKAGEYEKAAPAFQKTLQTDELEVQQLAYYNLGNTQFRLGQQTVQEKPEETIKTWQEALQSYEAALKLNPNDADAKYNRDLVKKKLEELQKQQQQKQDQQQQQQQQDQQNQDQKDQQQQQQGGKGQGQKEQENKDQEQKNEGESGEQKQNQQKPEPSDKQGDKPDQQQQAKNEEKPGDKPDDTKTADNKGDKPQDEKKDDNGRQQPQLAKNEPTPGQQQPQPQPGEAGEAEEQRAPGEMSKQEAKALLDSLQKGERQMPLTPGEGAAGVPQAREPGKDW